MRLPWGFQLFSQVFFAIPVIVVHIAVLHVVESAVFDNLGGAYCMWILIYATRVQIEQIKDLYNVGKHDFDEVLYISILN